MTTPELQRLAANLRAARGDRSQTTIADAAGITQPMLSRYESGGTVPNTATLMNLADALGVPAGKLLDGN